MLTQEYKELITVLAQKTEAGVLPWQKGRSRFTYEVEAGGNKFIVDKYFAGNHNDACLNLSTLDNKGDLVLEIVLCKGIAEQIEDYNRLGQLYSKVEQRVNNGAIQQEIPVVMSITQSLQQVV